jgi:hypothetical protein
MMKISYLNIFRVESGGVLSTLACHRRRLDGAVLWIKQQNRVPMSQQMWDDKDPSLLKGHKRLI